ncbi:tRNA-dihydrouridine synthase 3 [Tulasnella sp. 419]|nr:tRNA-dihydrouridine synthase 3 [Tulasnella sp. 419]
MTSIENISNPGIPKAPESLPAGYAKIKPEFVVLRPHIADPSGVEEPANDTGNEQSSFKDLDPALNSGADEPPKKKLRLSGAEKKKLAREEGKKKRGMNTNRKFALMKDDVQLCWKAAVGEQCPLQEKCYYSHEVSKYLETKPRDIHFPSPSALSSDPPFVLSSGSKSDGLGINSIDPTASCPVYLRTGVCPQGFKCRFLGNHIKRDDDSIDEPGWKLIMDESLAAGAKEDCEGNNIGISVIKQVRTRKYPTPLADRYIAETQQDKEVQDSHDMSVDMNINTTRPGTLPEMAINQLPEECQKETPDVPMRPQEKKRLHWKGLLYLAPLTTVGNLPFRRLCVDYGAQITCSEMAVATSLLSGSREEWSLVRRLPSERAFGIQVAGSKIAPLTQIAEIFRSEFGLGAEGRGTGVDFVDVNCGCPIDLVFKSGAGSARLCQS